MSRPIATTSCTGYIVPLRTMRVVLVVSWEVTCSVKDASTNELSAMSTSSSKKNSTSLMVMLWEEGPASIMNLNIRSDGPVQLELPQGSGEHDQLPLKQAVPGRN